ncbi:hypothetical protein KR222_006612 [Zaprionus bogoriensis]|nr:hypothetical protein KR222_006612 [Zaprionus bogoriensis]
MKSGKLKRNFWLTAEIECMLNLMNEVKVTQGGLPTTTNHTFTQIANKMKKRGFPNKSPTQVRRKWFQMKSAYLCYKKGNVDRLFLIPEKFRNVIAQFVENGNKIRRTPKADPDPAPAAAPAPAQPPAQSSERKQKKPMSVVDAFLAEVKQNNSLLNAEFSKFEETLMSYEQQCQSMRDSNIIKYLEAGE